MKKWLCLCILFFCSQGIIATNHDAYFIGEGVSNNNPIISRGKYISSTLDKKNYPYRISIYWEYIPVGKGMPNTDESDLQYKFEENVQSLDQQNISHLVLVITGEGLKEWHWYVKDKKDWMAKFNQALIGYPVYPIEIEIEYEPTWDVYQYFMDHLNTSDSANNE